MIDHNGHAKQQGVRVSVQSDQDLRYPPRDSLCLSRNDTVRMRSLLCTFRIHSKTFRGPVKCASVFGILSEVQISCYFDDKNIHIFSRFSMKVYVLVLIPRKIS